MQRNSVLFAQNPRLDAIFLAGSEELSPQEGFLGIGKAINKFEIDFGFGFEQQPVVGQATGSYSYVPMK